MKMQGTAPKFMGSWMNSVNYVDYQLHAAAISECAKEKRWVSYVTMHGHIHEYNSPRKAVA